MTVDRKEVILSALKEAHPSTLSATTLASRLNVSRQVIVGDIALLRARGHNITATPRGYVYFEEKNITDFPYQGLIACIHSDEMLIKELYTVVDFGGTVIDVTVEHSLYGQISAPLDIGSRHQANLFVNRLREEKALPLSTLTDGIHLHKVGCKDKETFQLIKEALEKEGILFEG